MINFILTFLAGFFDAIIGGGGLITVPLLELELGHFSQALATNKLLAFTTSFIGFITLSVYSSKVKQTKLVVPIIATAIVGSLAGSASVLVSQDIVLKSIFTLLVPLVLFLTFKKSVWKTSDEDSMEKKFSPLSGLIIFACGYYDGLMGPGSGILLFLSLLIHFKISSIHSLLITKLVLTCTCLVAIAQFSNSGLVNWEIGLGLSPAIILGTFIGSLLVTKLSHKIIRPFLVLIAVSLLLKAWLY